MPSSGLIDTSPTFMYLVVKNTFYRAGRQIKLHAELMARLAPSGSARLDADLYATAYRPVERAGQPALNIWEQALCVGQPLPTIALWPRGALCLPVDLGVTYERSCREQRILADASGHGRS